MTPTTDLQKLLAEATKGPWRVGKTLCGFYPAIVKDFHVGHNMNVTGAIHGYMYHADQKANQQANARLIAMAPDLAARVIELEDQNADLQGRIIAQGPALGPSIGSVLALALEKEREKSKALEAENKRLREADKKMKAALAYYADDGAKPNRDGPWMQDSVDFGDLARCTLAEVADLKGGEI